MKNVTILGGDRRSFLLGKLLEEDGQEVTSYGFEILEPDRPILPLKEAIESSDIIIAPLPFSKDNKYLHTPYTKEKIELATLFQYMKKNQLLLGGYIPRQLLTEGREKGFRIIDYFVREELQWLNAIPTVEGALQLAMEKQDITIHGSKVLVLGFGRIGKLLADRLHHLGAEVAISARKHSELAIAKAYGYEAVHLNDIDNYLNRIDTLFNTIPALILTKEKLKKIQSTCLLIDLASYPGGIDYEAAKALRLEAHLALGLPGKHAPLTAARCIRDTIYNILFDLEVSR